MPREFKFGAAPEDTEGVAPSLPRKLSPVRRPSDGEIDDTKQLSQKAGFIDRRFPDGHLDVSPSPVRHRKGGRPRGPSRLNVTLGLNVEDAELFKKLCDEDWDGITYRDGFKRLLEEAGYIRNK